MPIPTYYPANYKIRCPHCSAYLLLAQEVKKENTPIDLVCQACDEVVTWDTLPILPKLDPSIPAKHLLVPQQDTLENQEQVDSIKAVATSESFFALARGIGDTTNFLFTQIADLQAHIFNFREQIAGYFKTQWEYADRIQNWDDSKFLDFIHFPFVSIPIACQDKISRAYCRWVLYPSFWPFEFGIPVSRNPGFSVDLMTQYTRMNVNLSTEFTERLGVPQTLDLQVKGQKILGASLPFCWQDIPGVARDMDHTENWPSVYIKDKRLAALWLSNRGVNPWTERPVINKELSRVELSDIVLDNKHLLRAWKKFIKTGRIGLFWPEMQLSEARRFVIHAAMQIHGVCAVIVSTETDKMFYKSMMQTEGGNQNKVIVMTADENILWDAVMRTSLVAIDLLNGVHDSHLINEKIINNLFSYTGRFILVGVDATMDTQYTNAAANTIHALCGHELYCPPEFKHKRIRSIDYEDTADIKKTLQLMQNKSG